MNSWLRWSTRSCVGAGTGWTPAHLALFEGDRLRAAAPA